MFIDTHCHIEDKYYDDKEKYIKEAYENKIERLIVSGCEKDTINEIINFINSNKNIYGTIGYHPDQTNIIIDEDIEYLKECIKNNNKIIGIGEIGLDYHYGKENKEQQKELFRKQLMIAEEFDLPVVIHTRDATEDTINILKEYKVKGIIHCFSGSLEVANIYLKLGYKLGIGGVVTFKNSKLSETLKNIDIKNIVLETDSPYLAPEPFRGETNSSKYIPVIAKQISDIYNISLNEVENITTDNALQVFTHLK